MKWYPIASLAFVMGVIAPGTMAESGHTPSDDEIRGQLEALSLARKEIEELKVSEPSYAALRLGKIMWKAGRQNIYQVDERLEVHRLAKEAFMAIPDHADYLAKHIEQERAKMAEEVRLGGGRGTYDRERDLGFAILRQTPTPSAVKVLGEFLNDDRDEPPPPETADDLAHPSANSRFAAKALGELIANPPVKSNPRSYGKADIETWKLWYAQVKAGNREFQFKGDDRVYRMDKK